MAVFDVIESIDEGAETMVSRFPAVASGEIKLGSQLIVRENQQAVFFRDGKSYDSIGPGRHTLTTGNIPLLTDLLGKYVTDGSPFKAEVYFVNMRPFRDMKWGTPEPILFRDKELAMVRLRSFGIFSIKVNDPVLFVNKVVGTEGRFEMGDIEGFLRNLITARLADVLGESMDSVLDLARLYDEMGAALKSRVTDDFNKYGIDVVDLVVNAISVPPEVQAVIDERTGMGAVGNLNQYYQFKAAKAMEKAAEQEGGGMGEGLGIGAGLGMGMQMMGMMGGAARSTTTEPCPKCGNPMPTGSNFCPSCGNKIGLPDSTIIACPACGADNAPTAKFCAACGKEIPVAGHCPKCGSAVDADDKFCPECGEEIKASKPKPKKK
jgi:membrane protease subunit (stomatin/prohibitin family)